MKVTILISSLSPLLPFCTAARDEFYGTYNFAGKVCTMTTNGGKSYISPQCEGVCSFLFSHLAGDFQEFLFPLPRSANSWFLREGGEEMKWKRNKTGYYAC